MIWIPGRTFRMGSDHHYREERPADDVRVDGFWIDRYPVTNERFAEFVRPTGHVTVAEVAPNAQDYPNAKPDMLCRRYRPAARFPEPITTSTSHVGFRYVVRVPR
jgi:formylglycine-generating enzyme